jgi:sirohydrochlorin cobaltochelatase
MPILHAADLVVKTDPLGDFSTITLPPLPVQRPLLMVGHGTRNHLGRQRFLDFAQTYQQLDPSRPVFPCFLELTEPSIQDVIDQCVIAGHTELTVLPILLFAARHNKFDVTNELDLARQRYPQLTYHYGRHFGITPEILELWRSRLAILDTPKYNPDNISRADTILLFVGRGSSDPDANSDVTKIARMLWEGSEYQTVETCFIGISHPRLEEGFRRVRLYNPERIIVLPYFLFTGVLVEKIFEVAAVQQSLNPSSQIVCLPEMGLNPQLLRVLRNRELETQIGQVSMNCETCKFRLTGLDRKAINHHHHTHNDGNGQDHSHNSSNLDDPTEYHQRIWSTP